MDGKHCIVIIDDEKHVREVIADNLRLSGYEIIEAENGEQIPALIDTNSQASIVITDVIMPGKDGLETLLEIRETHPEIKIIAISGGGRHKNMDLLRIAKNLGADAVLQKPLDLDALEKAIEEMVA